MDDKNDGRIWLNCRSCKKEFYLAEKEINFLKERNWALPARCFGCRQFEKALKERDKQG
jgi:hypothetical protein